MPPVFRSAHNEFLEQNECEIFDLRISRFQTKRKDTMVSIRFPKEHKAFLNDSKTRRNIKKLEDRIEQMHQTHDLIRSLEGIDTVLRTLACSIFNSECPVERTTSRIFLMVSS